MRKVCWKNKPGPGIDTRVQAEAHFFQAKDLQNVPKLIIIRIVVSTKHVRVLTSEPFLTKPINLIKEAIDP